VGTEQVECFRHPRLRASGAWGIPEPAFLNRQRL
jgi:hypothetical protein